jgi:hypothetical protein
MRIDLTATALANRQSAEQKATETLEEMARLGDSTALLLFGESIATVSWLDGFLCTLLQSEQVAVQVAVVTSLEDTREHIDMTLRRRNLAVLSCFDDASLSAGDVTVLGDVSATNNDAFAIVRDGGEVLVADVAAKLHISIEAAQQRLMSLVALRLISRSKIGKAYAYQLPRIEARELETT